MARKATWQRHADPRSAYVARYILYIYIIHIIYRDIQPSVARKGIQISLSVGHYKPDGFTYFFPCGTKSHTVSYVAGHVERGETSDRQDSRRSVR